MITRPAVPAQAVVLTIALAGVGMLAAAKKPDGDLATYAALIEVVGRCTTIECIWNAGDSVQASVLRDPLFSFILVPFHGNASLGIAVFAMLTYGAVTLALARLTRGVCASTDAFVVAFLFATSVAVLPVTLSTHLLRQSLATGLFLLIYSRSSPFVAVVLTAPLAAVHRGATAIAALAGFCPPALMASAIAAAYVLQPSIPADMTSYALQEQATNTGSLLATLAPSTFVYFRIRQTSRRAARLAGNAVLLLAAMVPFGESLAVTRTFTSCLLLLLPGFAAAALAGTQSLQHTSRNATLAGATTLLLGLSAYRDAISPFSYDWSRLFGP